MANQKEYSIKINGIKESINDTSSLGDKLNSLNEGMKSGVGDANNYATSIKGIKKEIKAIQDEMAGLEKGSKAWTDLAKKAGELKDKVDDIRQATARFASDTKALDDVINLAKSATSAFGVLQGAMSEFGANSEEAAEAIKKLQATMTILTSLQQLQNSLKGSSATAELLTRAMKLLGIGMDGATTATKAFRIALSSIGIGIAIALITTLYENWDKLASKIGIATEAQKKANKMFEVGANAYAETSAELEVVTAKVNAFNGSKEQEKQLVDELNNKYGEAFGHYKTLAEWKVALTKKTDAYCKSLANEAEIQALVNELTENRKKQREIGEEIANGGSAWNQFLDDITPWSDPNAVEKSEKEKDKLVDQAKEIKAEIKSLVEENNKIAQDSELFNFAPTIEKNGKKTKKAADDAKKAAEKAAKEEEERRKKLYSEQSKYNQLLLNEQTIRYNEDLRNIHNEMDAQDELISKYKDEQKELEKIIKSEKTSKNARKQAQDEWNKLNGKIIDSQKEKNRLIDQEAEIQKQLIRLEQDRKTQSVFDTLKEEIREELKLKEISNEEFMNYINQDSEQFNTLSDGMKQTVINALQEIHNQAVQSQLEIDKVNDAANKAKKKNEEKPTTTPTAPKKSSNFGYGADIDEVFGEGFSDSKIKGFAEEIGKKLAAAMNVVNDLMLSPIEEAFTMMMELEVEEAQEALDEVSALYDQAQEKTEESRDRLTEIENQMQNASGARLEQLKAQQADEMAMMAEREAEEKRLEKEKQKREKELEQKQKQQRKLDLKFQLIKAIASNALAILEALTLGPILGPIFAAIIGAMGAIQIAVIQKQMSKLADGGLLQGKSHSQGGIPVGNTGIEVEGGEYVVNKRSTAKYLPLLQALNEEGARHKTFANQVGKYANGGELNSQRITSNYDYLNNSKAIERTIEAIDIHPVVSVVDINQGQKNLVQVREMAGGNS